MPIDITNANDVTIITVRHSELCFCSGCSSLAITRVDRKGEGFNAFSFRMYSSIWFSVFILCLFTMLDTKCFIFLPDELIFFEVFVLPVVSVVLLLLH